MKKLKSDSTWSGISAEQRKRLAGWLLEENLPYREALERVQKEFGVTGPKSSLARFYRHLMKERALKEMAETQKLVERLDGTGPSLRVLRASGWKALAQRFMERSLAGEDLKELVILGRLLARHEELENQRRRLAQERLEFEAEKAALTPVALEGHLARKNDRLRRN